MVNRQKERDLDFAKIADILEYVNRYGIPLMEAGAQATGFKGDDLIVAFFKGGMPAVANKMGDLQEDVPEFGRILPYINLFNQFGIPLIEAGARQTGMPWDDLTVALLKGGLPKLIEALREKAEG